jgi:transmembrane sensor
MNRPPSWIGSFLDADVDVETRHRLWRRIRARRDGRARRSHSVALVAAFSVGVVVAVLCGVTVWPKSNERIQPPVVSEAPLKLRGGMDWGTIETGTATRTADLEDGSFVVVKPGSRLASLENTGRSVVLLMTEGRATFDVKPGGPRRWSIETGLATVDVVGTRFTIDRSQSKLVVEVERGVVLVRGERVTDRVRQLTSGERLEIDGEPAAPAIPETSASAVDVANARPRSGVRPRDEASWQEMAQRGDYAEAYRNLGATGIAANVKAADPEQLFALADVARLSGHPADAIEPLERILAEHPRNSKAALAAFTLGRLHLDSLGNAKAAALEFQRAMSLELPRALAEDVHLRLIEARARAGDRPGAHEAWLSYVERFASSTRRPTADRWGRDP